MIIRKVLVAHDFSDAATRALQFAHQLATGTHAKLEIVYAYADLYETGAIPTLTLPHALPGQSERYLHFLEEELRRLAESALGEAGRDIVCRVVRGDPVKRIEDVARETGADVLCVGATGKGAVARVMLGSVSQLLVRTSPIPVLLVP